MKQFVFTATLFLLLQSLLIPATQGLSTRTKMNIRPVEKSDLTNLKKVIDSNDLFPSELLDDMIKDYLAGTPENKEIWLTTEDSSQVVAFCAPEKMTSGTFNLYLIAVHPWRQGKGIGTEILQHLEKHLVEQQQARILLVETSGNMEFDTARKFYQKCGFQEEARIREFYDKGEDKIVFWKKLGSTGDNQPTK